MIGIMETPFLVGVFLSKGGNYALIGILSRNVAIFQGVGLSGDTIAMKVWPHMANRVYLYGHKPSSQQLVQGADSLL